MKMAKGKQEIKKELDSEIQADLPFSHYLELLEAVISTSNKKNTKIKSKNDKK